VVSAAAADPTPLAVVADPALSAAAVVAAVSARVEAAAMAVVAVPMGAVALTGEAAAERGVLLARRYRSRVRSPEIYFRSKLTSI
jgi:hypothetical protein